MSEPIRARIYKEVADYDDVLQEIKTIIETGEFNCAYRFPDKDNFLPFYLDDEEIAELKQYCNSFPFVLAFIANEVVEIKKLEKNLEDKIIGAEGQ